MIPKSLKQISVKQYQKIHPFLKENTVENWITILSILSGKSEEYFESIDIKDLKAHIKSLSFLTNDSIPFVKRYIWIKGRIYKAENDAELLSTSQYVSIKTFCVDPIENLHNIAAVAYKRLTLKGWVYDYTEHKKVSEAILEKSALDIIPMVFFCSKVLKHSMENSPDYLEAQEIIAMRIKEILSDENFIQNGAGSQLSTR